MPANTVGERIKQLRDNQNITLEELAERSGVNRELIKKIEEGDILPSLTPLIKISRTLGVRLGTLLDDRVQDEPVIVRRGKTQRVIHFSGYEESADTSNLNFHSLGAGKSDRHMEPFLIDVELHSDDFELSSHEGEEFIYVLEGEIEVIYGQEKYRLGEGDSIYYDSVVPHHLHAAGENDAKILAVVYTPF
ncbi:helix-turn-helix domain-containing protein [Methanothermobacter sp. THM-2]|uniref:helix-turn-helix domain-containing protein n=1 Tax=Methanothermobacter sp. THM-2 TaxID=2606912 RepID=UPI0013659E11|nr:XRE family transcriptional regulator [Methanothermobacter sp. THM-2]QHN07532.1 helix-turn-helix domain-containing protein [Methanothermobacter sp. THM-2]